MTKRASLGRAAPLGDLAHLVLEGGDPRLRPGIRCPGAGIAPRMRFGQFLDAGRRHERAHVCVGQEEQAILQERAPGLANARVPPAALAGGHRDREIAVAFRHAARGGSFAGLKTGRFVHAFRFIFAVDLLMRPAPPNVAPISCRAITGSLHAEPSGRSKNTGAPPLSSREWMRVARAQIERAPALQSLLLGLAITVLDEHGQERERVEMHALSRAERALGQIRDGLIDLAPAPSLVGVVPFNHDQTAHLRLECCEVRASGAWPLARHRVGRAVAAVERDRIDRIGYEPESPQEFRRHDR